MIILSEGQERPTVFKLNPSHLGIAREKAFDELQAALAPEYGDSVDVRVFGVGSTCAATR